MLKSELQRKKLRIRPKVKGNATSPRLNVYKSTHFIYAQLIDDTTGNTLAAAHDLQSTGKATKLERAGKVGEKLAELALAKKIKRVHFDRGGFLYHGRVKALAEGARSKGLQI